LKGKVAVVSGSSCGIGAAIGQELSRRGASVVINYPSPDHRSQAWEAQSTLAEDTRSLRVEADLANPNGSSILVEAAVRKCRKVDILVNDALR
jgi:3-oxoacyl-[acyl-carrier protein] reductase